MATRPDLTSKFRPQDHGMRSAADDATILVSLPKVPYYYAGTTIGIANILLVQVYYGYWYQF